MRKLTGKRAVWLGLVATPVLVVAAVATIGVAGSSAGPATTAQAVPGLSADGLSVVHQGAVSAAAVEAYWTPERMAAAQPMVKTMAAGAASPEIAGNSATGAPGFAGGVTASGQPVPAPSPTGIPQTSGGQLPADGAYPGPKASFKWYPRYLTYPQGTVGKMFFNQDHDGNGTLSGFACSGSVIFVVRVDVVQVAGHCMHNGLNGAGFGGGWSQDILFCPSYLNGVNAARGCWAWDGYGIVRTPWFTNGSFDTDWGWFRTAATGTVHAAEIANVTGGLGFAWNQGRDQLWWNWGYPGQPSGAPWSFDGGDLVLCTSEHRYDLDAGPGPASNSMGCGSGRGSSGGPWVMSAGNNGNQIPVYINSVNSWIFLAEEGFEIQGPYADTDACSVMEDATGWDAGPCP
jgi:hypothetical protein